MPERTDRLRFAEPSVAFPEAIAGMRGHAATRWGREILKLDVGLLLLVMPFVEAARRRRHEGTAIA